MIWRKEIRQNLKPSYSSRNHNFNKRVNVCKNANILDRFRYLCWYIQNVRKMHKYSQHIYINIHGDPLGIFLRVRNIWSAIHIRGRTVRKDSFYDVFSVVSSSHLTYNCFFVKTVRILENSRWVQVSVRTFKKKIENFASSFSLGTNI